MKKFTVKLIPGDGIGVDVIHEAVRVLEALAGNTAALPLIFRIWNGVANITSEQGG